MLEERKSFRNYIGWLIVGAITAPFIFGFVILGLVLLKYLYDLASTKYIFDEKSVIVRQGIICFRQKEIRYCDIRCIGLKQGILQRIFRVGDIAIACAASDGIEIIINGIAEPQKIMDYINERR